MRLIAGLVLSPGVELDVVDGDAVEAATSVLWALGLPPMLQHRTPDTVD